MHLSDCDLWPIDERLLEALREVGNRLVKLRSPPESALVVPGEQLARPGPKRQARSKPRVWFTPVLYR